MPSNLGVAVSAGLSLGLPAIDSGTYLQSMGERQSSLAMVNPSCSNHPERKPCYNRHRRMGLVCYVHCSNLSPSIYSTSRSNSVEGSNSLPRSGKGKCILGEKHDTLNHANMTVQKLVLTPYFDAQY